MKIKWDDFFDYDESCPSCLRWKVSRARQKKGQAAGSMHKRGYMRVRLLGSNYLVHRVVYELCTGDEIGDLQIDHIDGDTGNNKISNLRKVTQSLQSKNLKMYSTNTSGHTGTRFTMVFGSQYAQAYWNEDGCRKFVQIRCKTQDDPEAMSRAKNLRDEAIERLTSQGDGYTLRHGKIDNERKHND